MPFSAHSLSRMLSFIHADLAQTYKIKAFRNKCVWHKSCAGESHTQRRPQGALSAMARSRLSVPTDLTQADAYELSALYNAKSVSPVEVTRAVLARAEKLQPQFNAYRHLVHPEIAQAVANAVRIFTEQGATVVEVERVIEDPTPILTALAAERAARNWPERVGAG